MTIRGIFIRLAVLTLVAALTGGGAAYGQAGGQQHPQGRESAENFTQEELEAFAEAQREIEKINRKYEKRMESAQDPAKKVELGKEANTRTVQAVLDAGLDVARYNAIASAASEEPRGGGGDRRLVAGGQARSRIDAG